MKLKYPNSITILDTRFKIEYNEKGYGGWFDFEKDAIGIGTKYKTETQIFHIITHELFEICMELLNVRYQDPSVSSNFKFFLDHKEFEAVSRLFSTVITKFIQ